MAEKIASKKGKKNRKYGRNRIKCQKYKDQDRREINKKRKLAKIAKNLGNKEKI
jgi:hypothetical protein